MKRILLLILALAVVVSACSGGSLLATVNGEEITAGDVDELIAEDSTTVSQDFYAKLIETLIIHRLISAAAEEQFDVVITDEEVNESIAGLRAQIEAGGGTLEDAVAQQGLSMAAVPIIIEEDLTEQKVAVALAENQPDPLEEDILAAFNSSLRELTEVCASHILVATEEEAQAALDRIEAGEAFEDVAAELGTDGTAEVGGDLGCAPAANYVAEFAAATMEADLDVPTGPVESQFGYHVILVRDRTEPVLDDYRADIVASLRSQAQQSLLGDWMLEVVGAADVTVEEEYGTWESEPFPSVVPPAQ